MRVRKRRRIPSPIAVTRALREFLATEVAGGVVLLVAAVVGILWANSPWDAGYASFWGTEVALQVGGWDLTLDLRHWVNEGLMALFFVVVGLEVKRELLEGELQDRRRAALPVVAAIGGMVVPAVIFIAIAGRSDGSRGWGIPMATDIAFALAVAAVVGRGLPSSLRLFLLTLAIVDDIGAIVVIAIAYSENLDFMWLGAAVAVIAIAYGIRRLELIYTPLFIVLGVMLWLALYEAGVHPTLAGVAMGLLAPATPVLEREIVVGQADELLNVFSPEAARTTSKMAKLAVSQMEWIEHGLHPWTSIVIVPIFALANAGVPVSASAISDAFSSPVAWGVVLGLVAGKTVGITLFAWLGCRAGIAELPSQATWRQLMGMAALGGIGFTVSLFVTGLAFDAPALVDEARIGILVASILATLVGAALLHQRHPSASTGQSEEPAVSRVAG